MSYRRISKFRTIDIEGDGLCKDVNQELFPEGNHFDPGTVIWCVTFCDQDYNTITLVKKLPPHTRHVKDGKFTKTYHKIESVVPKDIDSHKIIEFTDNYTFVKAVADIIRTSDVPVYSKGYGAYNYETMVLKANFNRNGYNGDVEAESIISLDTSKWEQTANQIRTGQWIDNEQYMINGIRHNIEDAVQLAKRVNNGEIRNASKLFTETV